MTGKSSMCHSPSAQFDFKKYECYIKSMSTKKATNPIFLSASDWSEIYYALDSKAQAVRDGHYDGLADDSETQKKRWIAHLRDIKKKIGPDGAKAACQGVLPAVSASVIQDIYTALNIANEDNRVFLEDNRKAGDQEGLANAEKHQAIIERAFEALETFS
jgi:hypothetical protein